MVAGAVAGAGTLACGLLALLGYQLRNLQRLVEWTHEPVGTPVPRAIGIWSPAFADLARRTRLAYDLRERLSAALERFREASQAMPDGVMYLSESDRIEWINGKAEQHFDLDHNRDVGVPVTHLVRQPEFVRYLASGSIAEPLLMQSARRPGLSLLVQVVPFGDDQRMIVSRDISQLEKLENMRRDFIANVSHELRTPLTVVSGFLETLIDGLDDDLPREEAIRYLRLAHEQSMRMQCLIEDLLTLAALETDAPAAAEEEIGVGELVREVFEETRMLSAGRHQVDLAIEDAAQGDIVLGSRKELHSAFANLASNAVRYTPSGGTLALSWCRADHGGEFAVQDNGIGIEAGHIPRLTERFYRVDRGRSRETGGTGLGLAIVKHILSRHQAELRVDSAPGKGSRFGAVFPAARVRRATPPVARN